ncbi:MAG: sugar transferase [Candidatus Omnitrophica bacterium]|nr:sugar transferase [Candidatus Omnitrophota bacterium]
MIKRSEVFVKQLVLLIDLAVLVVAFLATYALRQSVQTFYLLDLIPGREAIGELYPLDRYLWLLLIILPLWIGILYALGGYRELRNKSYRQIAAVVLKACALGLLFFGSFVFVLKLHYVSRLFMGMFFLLSFLLLAYERTVVIVCFHLMLQRGYFHRNLLLVGTGRRARAVIKDIQGHQNWGVGFVGLLDADPGMVEQHVEGVEVIGTLEELPRMLQERVIDEVVFVVPRTWMARIEEAIRACELAGVRASVAVDLFNMRFAKSHPSALNGTPFISFDTTSTDQWQVALKRVLDVVIAGLGLVVLLPLFVVVSLLIKATSSGPVLFQQVRCGLNGRRFTLYKFRSMVMDAEAKRAELAHLNELNGPVFKLTNDPRLTPVGRWLRKMSLDELPQLYNVFKGEMSLVGPRPPIPGEVEQYQAWQRRRLSMRPGITGQWQVNGRNHIVDFDKWMRLDLEYIDRWSLALDVKILAKTIPAVFFGVGAK